MEEVWKDIKGYEGLYQVSNLGRVKSLPKEWSTGNGGKARHSGKILSCGITSSGYYNLNLCKDGKKKTYEVHKLVAMSFLNHKPCGHDLVVDHIDDNKLNNRVDNLQIVSARFNTYKTQGKHTSKYKGVSWNKRTNKWQSQIYIDGKQNHLGHFNEEIQAHLAYQEALKQVTNKNK